MNQFEKTFYKKINFDNNISVSKLLLSVNIFDKRNLIIGLLASSRPILTMLNREGNNLIVQAHCAFIAEAGEVLFRKIKALLKITYNLFLKNIIIGCLTLVLDKDKIRDFVCQL